MSNLGAFPGREKFWISTENDMHVSYDRDVPAAIDAPALAQVLRDSVGECFEAQPLTQFDVAVAGSGTHYVCNQLVDTATDLCV